MGTSRFLPRDNKTSDIRIYFSKNVTFSTVINFPLYSGSFQVVLVKVTNNNASVIYSIMTKVFRLD